MKMGVNLIPVVSGFRITTQEFSKDGSGDPSAVLGCITPGKHRVLRFQVNLHNKGDKDLVIGNPADRPDLFVRSESGVFEYVFKEKFYTFRLTDETGTEKKTGYKVAFCLMDFSNPNKYNCGHQGVGVGGHDEYAEGLPCQFIEIDDLPDGRYILQVTANAHSVETARMGKGNPVIPEDNYDDNTASVKIEIQGIVVKPIP